MAVVVGDVVVGGVVVGSIVVGDLRGLRCWECFIVVGVVLLRVV